MATPARTDQLKPASARINSCLADFHVTSPKGPLSSPETLLAAVRREILPALSDVLDSPEWQGITIRAEQIDIDLGHWPEDPVWSDVRYVLATKLRYALADYLPANPTSPVIHEVTADTLENRISPTHFSTSEEDTNPTLNHPRGADPRDTAPLMQDRSDKETDQPVLSQQQIARRIDAFVSWTQAAPDNKTLQMVLARLERHSDERQALIHVLREQSAPNVTGADTSARRLTDELGRTVAQALTRLDARAANTERQLPDSAEPVAVDKPPVPQKTDPHVTQSGRLPSADGQNTSKGDASSVPQTTDPRISLSDRLPFVDEQNTAQTVSEGDASHDLGAAPNGPGAGSARIPQAQERLIQSLLQEGVPDTIVHERSFALLQRLMPFLDPKFTTYTRGPFDAAQTSAEGSGRSAEAVHSHTLLPTAPTAASQMAITDAETPVEPIENAAEGASIPNKGRQTPNEGVEGAATPAQTAAKAATTANAAQRIPDTPATTDADGADSRKDGHQTPNVTQAHHDEGHQSNRPDAETKADAAVALGSTPEPNAARSLGDRGASPEVSSEPLTHYKAADLSEVGDDNHEHALSQIASALGVDQGVSPKDFCVRKLIQSPNAIFSAASELGALRALITLLRDEGPDTRPLLAKTTLASDKIRAMHTEDPDSLAKAVGRLTTIDAFDLARRLLPPSATLLVEHLTELKKNAKSPQLLMQHVTIALLNGDLLDFEDLAQRTETTLTAPNPERSAREERAENGNAAQGYESPSDPGQASDGLALPEEATNVPGTGSLAETIMLLAGFHHSEIERILGIPAKAPPRHANDRPRPDQTQAAAARNDSIQPRGKRDDTASTTDQSPTGRSDAELIEKLSALTKALAGPENRQFTDAAELLLRAWPMAQPDAETALKTAVLRTELGLATATKDRRLSLSGYLAAVAQEIEPDYEKRQSLLRVVAARLSIPISTDEAHLRHQTLAAIETLLVRAPQQTRHVETKEPEKPPEVDSETLLVTEVAGLVLLSPFFTLLFERLKIEWEGKALSMDAYPKALSALHYLAGTTAGPVVDPFHRVLLGLDSVTKLPAPQDLDEDAQVLMDGLLRSVVDRWGKLGATSPDGLRETFLRRTGTLRFDDTGAHLRVTAGPFDMLLDGLPWSIQRLVLPWMPLPCHVSWREDYDA